MHIVPKIISFLVCFFCIIQGVSGQNRLLSIDSLKSELDNHQERDQDRADILYQLAGSLFVQEGEHPYHYLDEVEDISKQISYEEGIAKSYYLRGILTRIEGKFDLASTYLLKALKVYKDLDDKEKCAHCYHHLAILNYQQGDQFEAIKYYEKFIQYMEDLGDKTSVAVGLNNIGNSYADLGKDEDALVYYKKALVAYEDVDNKDGIASSYNNIGTIYMSQGNNPKAFEFFHKALYLHESMGDSLNMVNSLNNLGIMYKKQEKYDKAIKSYMDALKLLSPKLDRREIAQIKVNMGMAYCYKKDYGKSIELVKEGLEMSRELNNMNHLSTGLNNMGDIYLAQNEYDTARSFYQKSIKVSLPILDKQSTIHSYLGVAKTYLEQNQYQPALDYALKCQEAYKGMVVLNVEVDIKEILWKIYKATGEHQKALENHEQFKLLSDSILNKENIQKITQIEYEYKYKQELESAEKRELKLTKKVESTSKDLRKSQHNSFIAVIIILLISLISVTIIFVLRLKHARTKTQNILIEQKLLRSQMTPHFMFNSLSVLQSMILNKESEKSIQYLSKFSKLLRTVLENSRHKLVSFPKEIEAIESYMALQNLDADPPYKYELSIDPELSTKNIEIPPMLIQPFIENAIEHAFPYQKDDREITVKLQLEEGQLKCNIEDNGIGIDRSFSKKNKNSMATTITSERLAMLSKEFKSKGSVEIKSKNGEQGTLVTLVIPYKMG